MNEQQIQQRITAILNEYSALPEFDKYDLTLESVGGGVVKVLITKGEIKFERTIKPDEDLSFIADTFHYPNTFTPRSNMFSLEGLTSVGFDEEGYLIAVHTHSTEKFRVNSSQREEVASILREKLGNKFKT